MNSPREWDKADVAAKVATAGFLIFCVLFLLKGLGGGSSAPATRYQYGSRGIHPTSIRGAGGDSGGSLAGYPTSKFCIACTGSGKDTCTRCHGSGHVTKFVGFGTTGARDEERDCPDCFGSGKVRCTSCGGDGEK